MKKALVICMLISSAAIPVRPCEQVVIGGYKPQEVGRIAGVIVGSGKIALMGYAHDAQRREQKVSGARVRVLARKDEEYAKLRHGEHGAGLMRWHCGPVVAETTSDAKGGFDMGVVVPGKYCLDMTAPEPESQDEKPMHAEFLVDVLLAKKTTGLLVDISPQWPDCSGGQYLKAY